MMLDNEAQVIFLLTYKHSRSEWVPLTAQEYSKIAYKIRETGLTGPKDLMDLSSAEMSITLDLDEPMALRIRNLLDLGGIASLYLERLFNQGIKLMTRTDQDYPATLKTLLRDNAPPYLCYVGNIELLSDYRDPSIVSANDISKLSAVQFTEDPENLICLIDSLRFVKQQADWSKAWRKSVIISSLGLAKLIRHPSIRKLINDGNTLIFSTNAFEATESNYHLLHLYLMAFAMSSAGSIIYHQHSTQITRILDHLRAYDYLNSRLSIEAQPTMLKGSAMIRFKQCERKMMPDLSDKKIESLQQTIYTIGHSNHEINTLLELLESHAIDLLVDIRSAPISKYAPQFNQQPLRKSLKDIGIQYKYLGSCLGGRPEDKNVLSSDGKIVREYIEQREWYQKGIQELIKLAKSGKRVALMCSEEDPAHCHRGYIVSNTLIEKGVKVLHIRANGDAQDLGILNSPTDQMEIPL